MVRILYLRIHIKPIYWIKRSRILTHSAPKYFLKKVQFFMWRRNLRKNKYNIYFGIYTFFFILFSALCINQPSNGRKSLFFFLLFTVPPSFLNNAFLATQTAIIQDEDVSIKCEVQGDPPLHISWKRKGLDINVALNSQFTVSLEWTHRKSDVAISRNF